MQGPAEKINQIAELVVSVGGAIAILWKGRTVLGWIKKGWFYIVVPKDMKRQIELLDAQTRANMEVMHGLSEMMKDVKSTIGEVVRELRPNGGSTMRDAINLIVAKQRARDNTTEEYGVFEADKDGWCTHCNLHYLRMTGRTMDEVVGNGWINCIHPDDRSKVREEWALSVHDGRDFELACRMIKPGGDEFNVIGRVVVMRDNNGKPIGYFGTVHPE